MSRDARGRILDRIQDANRHREAVAHPGRLPEAIEPPVPFEGGPGDPLDAFEDRFRAAGGEVVRFADVGVLERWLASFTAEFESVSVGVGVPETLHPHLPSASPSDAELGVSVAVGASAQTGSLLLSSREGRRSQLLPPVHLVWLRARHAHGTLCQALEARRNELPAALALHSGPSKSADIGRIIVTGVHGPGRIVAGIIEAEVEGGLVEAMEEMTAVL